VLGEKYIEISPGSVQQGRVKSGDKMVGTDLPPLADMMLNINTIGKSLQVIVKNIETTIRKNPKVLGQILNNANSTLENARKMITEVRSEVKPMVAQVKTSLTKMDRILDRADKALESVNYALKGGKDVRIALANVRRITTTVRKRVKGLMTKIDTFTDKGNKIAEKGLEIMDSVKKDVPKITSDLKVTIARARSVMTKIDSGKGTVAQLINEEELYEIVKETMKNLKRHPWKLIWRQ